MSDVGSFEQEVARAMWQHGHPEASSDKWYSISEAERRVWSETAQVAIAAYLKSLNSMGPTNEMREAGLRAYLENVHEPSAKDAEQHARTIHSAVSMMGIIKGTDLDEVFLAMLRASVPKD